jgi:soluble lytic murein transglycosylase-like protein
MLCLLLAVQVVALGARSELGALWAPLWTIETEGRSELAARLDLVEARMGAVEEGAASLEAFHELHVEPLADYLRTTARPWTRNRRGTADPYRIAVALVREGRREGIDPRLLAGVLLVENPWLDPFARSPVGAVGLMQVMPFHAGGWGCPEADLTHVETNVCHGARILAEYLRRTEGDLEVALLRYNGCTLGANTPDCHLYPSRVYRYTADGGPGGSSSAGPRAVEELP